MTFKPAPPHNPLKAPAVCLCVDCCRIVAELRCPAVGRLGRCGDFKGHRGEHPLLVATTFQIVEERLAEEGDNGER